MKTDALIDYEEELVVGECRRIRKSVTCWRTPGMYISTPPTSFVLALFLLGVFHDEVLDP